MVADAVDAGAQMRRAIEKTPEQRRPYPTLEERAAALAPVWKIHWADVELQGDRVVRETDTAACREALAPVLEQAFPLIADVYLCYAIVIAIVRDADKGKSDSDWSVHMSKRMWAHFCVSAGAGLEEHAADAIFEAVNEERSDELNRTATRLLSAGAARAQAEQLAVGKGETALKRSSFSISEFVEALVRVACVRGCSSREIRRAAGAALVGGGAARRA